MTLKLLPSEFSYYEENFIFFLSVYRTFRVVEVEELEVGTEVGWELGLIPYNGSPVFLGRLGANMNN
jgi:hypothetical protein